MTPGCIAESKIAMFFYLGLLLLLLMTEFRTDAGATSKGGISEQDVVYTSCGGTLKSPRGVISTPSFPNAYAIPIYCRWVIEAPADKLVALYFTQYYMREGLTVTEYAFFSDSMHLGKKEFGAISSDREPTFLVSNKPVLVLEFDVKEGGNVHLRVREHLLNVFGFNVTYEMIARNESVKKDLCLYNHCSFTGSCVTSSSFDRYTCSCFSHFFGPECQYDSDCGPSDNKEFCSNGGNCRYYIGSTVKTCECPPGFEGSRCENKKNPLLPAQCLNMGCSQTCFITGKGDYRCSCFSGHHLDRDEKTCLEKGRIRYLVSFKVYDQNVDLAHLDGSRYSALKAGIESTLIQLFQPRLHKAENLKVLSFKPAAVVQFHFFGESEDTHRAKALFEENLKRGRIGRYAVDKNYIDFKWEPALSIQGIELSAKMPLIEGNELTLACLVQGSIDMKVQWLKDGSPIDVETSYRNIWINVSPKNFKDQYTALISIDRTNTLDSGEFTCQVSDWGTVQNKSIHVNVVKVPDPIVIPLTSTVFRGSSFVVTCISEGDHYGYFGYNWLKNGRILNPSLEPEMIEDLFPGGSRLVVKKAIESAKYTCLTTSKSGSSKKDSTVTVLDSDGKIPLCPAMEYMEINWGQAAANTEDVQLCPKGYSGEVVRHCVMRRHSTATWTDPDFSRCLSEELVAVTRKFQSLKMGYMISDVSNILHDLRSCLWNMRENPHISSGEPIVDILEGIQDFQRTHYNIDGSGIKNNSQVFMDIASFLVETPQLIQKQSHIIKLHELILGYGLAYGGLIADESFHVLQRSSLVLEMGSIPKSMHKVLRFPIRGDQISDLPAWLTDSVELEFDSWFVNQFSSRNDSLSIAVVFYRNLSAFFPERFVAKHSFSSYESIKEPDLEYQLHSRLVAVAMQPVHRKLPSGTVVKRSTGSNLKVKARLAHLNHTVNRRVLWNISCGMADFTEGNVQFSMDGCIPIQTGLFSLCQCDRVGTYVVLLTTYAQSEEFHFPHSFDTKAGTGCAVCAFFVCLTFFILIVLWRKIKGVITSLKIQFCVAVIAAYGSILKSLQDSNNQAFYYYSIPLVQFFVLAAYSLQLCIGLIVYFEFVGFGTMRYKKLKFTILAWAVPMIVVGASVVAQVPDEVKHTSWWLKFRTKSFYSFTVSATVLIALQIMIVTAVRTEMKYYDIPESKSKNKVNCRWSLLCRSLIITFFLLMTSVTSILYVNYEEEYLKHAFGASSGILGFVVFLCYTACSENVHSLCSSAKLVENDDDFHNKEQLDLKAQKSPYQSFLKPEVVSSTYVSNKVSESVGAEESVRQLQKLSRLSRRADVQEWKDIEQLLIKKSDPSCVVRDFTVHHHHQYQQQISLASFPKELNGANEISELGNADKEAEPQKCRTRSESVDQDESSAAFELQQLEGSPKSSHIQLLDEDTNYELNHHGSAPDILETTSRQSTIERRRNAPRKNDESALKPELPKIVCSTFRPADGQTPLAGKLDVLMHENDRNDYQKQESDSDDQKPANHSTLPCPPIQSMIGDDKLVCAETLPESSTRDTESGEETNAMLKKGFIKKVPNLPHVGINVPIPKVPEVTKVMVESDCAAQQPKKGWNITAV